MRWPGGTRPPCARSSSLAATSGVCLVLFSACSSSNNDTSGGDAGTEGGIIRHPDGGNSSGGGEGGAGGVVAPTGSQILSSATSYLEGVTVDDGYAIYQDTTSSALYAVPVGTPNATPIAIMPMQGSDYMGGGGAPVVVGNSVLMVSGVKPTSEVGKLRARGRRRVERSSSPRLPPGRSSRST